MKYQGSDCNAVTGTKRPGVVWVPPSGNGGFGSFPTRGIWYSLHLGMGFPAGKFADTVEPGPSITLDLEYPFRETFSFTALAGYHIFHGKSQGPNVNITSFNLDLKHYFPVGSLTGYAEIGPGWYHSSTGSNGTGANAGVGLHFALQQNLALEVGSDIHVSNKTFIDTHLGATWRF